MSAYDPHRRDGRKSPMITMITTNQMTATPEEAR